MRWPEVPLSCLPKVPVPFLPLPLPDFSVRSWEGLWPAPGRLEHWHRRSYFNLDLATRLLWTVYVHAGPLPYWPLGDNGRWGGEMRAQGPGVGARRINLSLWSQDS